MLFYGSNINFNNDVGKNNKSSKNAGAIHHGTTEVKTISNAEITTSINNEEQDEPKIDRYHSDLENFKNDLKDTIDSEYLAIINNACLRKNKEKNILSKAIHNAWKGQKINYFEIELTPSARNTIKRSVLPIPTQAFAFRAEAVKLEESLFKYYQSDPCIEGIFSNDIVKLNNFQDNLYKYQKRYLDDIKYDDFYKKMRPFYKNQTSTYTVKIAIVDSGINFNHADLKDIVAVSKGLNVVDPKKTPMDYFGHGTSVAGVAAAAINKIGAIGIATNNIEIIPIKILNDYGVNGEVSDIYNGIEWAIKSNADVINLSMGVYNISYKKMFFRLAKKAIQNGSVFVSSAGNKNTYVSRNFPAGVGSLEGALTVAALETGSTEITSFSNYNNKVVEISAPGSEIPLISYKNTAGNHFERLDGTSFSAPMVAGAAAVIIDFWRNVKKDNISPAKVEEIILKTARKINGLRKYVTEGNVLNLSSIANELINSKEASKPIKPLILKNLSDAYAGKGENIILKVGAYSHNNDFTYEWYHNNKAIRHSNSNEYKFILTKQTSGRYYVKINNNAGSVNSHNINVKIVNIPNIKLIGKTGRAIRVNSHVSIEYKVEAKNDLKFSWFHNGTRLNGKDDKRLDLELSKKSAGEYWIEVDNGYVKTRGVPVYIDVLHSPEIISFSKSFGVKKGFPAKIQVMARANPMPKYEWFKNGRKISGADSNTLSISSFSMKNVGKYNVLVKNNIDSVMSKEINVFLLIAPRIKLSTNKTILKNSSDTLKIDLKILSGNPRPGISWYYDDINIKTKNINSLIVKHHCFSSNPSRIYVRAENEVGESKSNTINISHFCNNDQLLTGEQIMDEVRTFTADIFNESERDDYHGKIVTYLKQKEISMDDIHILFAAVDNDWTLFIKAMEIISQKNNLRHEIINAADYIVNVLQINVYFCKNDFIEFLELMSTRKNIFNYKDLLHHMVTVLDVSKYDALETANKIFNFTGHDIDTLEKFYPISLLFKNEYDETTKIINVLKIIRDNNLTTDFTSEILKLLESESSYDKYEMFVSILNAATKSLMDYDDFQKIYKLLESDYNRFDSSLDIAKIIKSSYLTFHDVQLIFDSLTKKSLYKAEKIITALEKINQLSISTQDYLSMYTLFKNENGCSRFEYTIETITLLTRYEILFSTFKSVYGFLKSSKVFKYDHCHEVMMAIIAKKIKLQDFQKIYDLTNDIGACNRFDDTMDMAKSMNTAGLEFYELKTIYTLLKDEGKYYQVDRTREVLDGIKSKRITLTDLKYVYTLFEEHISSYYFFNNMLKMAELVKSENISHETIHDFYLKFNGQYDLESMYRFLKQIPQD